MRRPKEITLQEHRALCLLVERGPALTVQLAFACGLVSARRCLPQARNMLRRLERLGFIARGDTPAGHYATWTITDAGRKAVQP